MIQKFLLNTQMIWMIDAEEDQNNLSKSLVEFNNKSRLKNEKGKYKKQILMKVNILFMKVEN